MVGYLRGLSKTEERQSRRGRLDGQRKNVEKYRRHYLDGKIWILTELFKEMVGTVVGVYQRWVLSVVRRHVGTYSARGQDPDLKKDKLPSL